MLNSVTVSQVVLDVMIEFREQKNFSGRAALRGFLQCIAPHLGRRDVLCFHLVCVQLLSGGVGRLSGHGDLAKQRNRNYISNIWRIKICYI